MSEPQTDYLKYRGKCKEMSEALIAEDPSLKLVRGHYDCPIWGMQPHWWCVKTDGAVIDPTKRQFPSKGIGEYIPFDGNVTCANCGKGTTEDEAQFYGNYSFCSTECICRFVGL